MSEEETKSMVGMSDEEKVQFVAEQSMSIIMNAGDARNLAREARQLIVEHRYDEARAKLKEADHVQAKAHNVQTAMIQGDIRGGDEKMGYFVLFAHAQDTLMTIQVEINMTKDLLKMFEARDHELDERLANLGR